MKKNIGKEFFDISNEISDLLYKTEAIYKSILKLGKVESAYLNFLKEENKPTNMKRLSEELNVSHSRITHLTDSLIKKGYVDRVSSTEDRRVYLAFLTDKATDLLNKENNDKISIYNKLIEELPEEKSLVILDALCTWKNFLEKLVNEKK
jgi:DNA-binding MarR family transcriptional regulator